MTDGGTEPLGARRVGSGWIPGHSGQSHRSFGTLSVSAPLLVHFYVSFSLHFFAFCLHMLF